jgi:hypothetical protein
MSNHVENGQDLQKITLIFKGSFNFIYIYIYIQFSQDDLSLS